MTEIIRNFNHVVMTWPGGEHSFVLNIGGLLALQQICDAGPNVILNRLQTGAWNIEDIRSVLRLGLIGAGMDATKAKHLVHDCMKSVPLLEFVMPAHIILAAALVGAVGEDDADSEDQDSSDDDEDSEAGNVEAPET